MVPLSDRVPDLAALAIWADGSLPPAGAARDLLAHVTAGRPVTTR